MAALDFFDQARDEVLERMFGHTAVGPASFGGGVNNQQERYAEQARRGAAPPTVGNLAGAFGNALGVMGTSAITAGATSLAEMAAGVKPGTYGGFTTMTNHYSIPQGNYRNLAAWNKAVRAARDRAAASRDPSEGARGHTGERSDRGQAGGGPRGGQQQGGGKRAF